jgi:hypothetical protein
MCGASFVVARRVQAEGEAFPGWDNSATGLTRFAAPARAPSGLADGEGMASLDMMMDTDPFADLDVPPQLEESLMHHRRHLAQLIRAMKTAGVSEEHMEESVSEIIASYKAELLAAIRSMGAMAQHGEKTHGR